MNTDSDISKVLGYIEENMRVTEQTSIEYLDSQGHITRLSRKQNHVVFGRRGSGKSLLLKELRKANSDFICIHVNLEDFKDISFPNSIIQVQKSVIKQLLPVIKQRHKKISIDHWKKSNPLIRKLNRQVKELDSQLRHPDEYEQSVRQKKGSKLSGKGKAKTPYAEVQSDAEVTEEIETSKQIIIDKLEVLKNGISELKELYTEASGVVGKDLFLILDDFYFIRKEEQPFFLDFFHRVSKNTPLYLKVATIKHRSRLYLQQDSYIGIEIPHDAQPLNLDYSLSDFTSLVGFMKNLLLHINEKVGVSVQYDDLITDNAFRFLCLASGGVPRDFFSLLISLGPQLKGDKSISKPNVIEKAIENVANKMEAFKKDAADEENVLEHYLNFISQSIISDKKWNAFLVSNSDIKNYSQINQAIKELADMRFLHLVTPNTSAASSDGTRYSAYMVDVGLFPNANPRDFQQVEPDQKDKNHRKDKIRSAPKLNLEEFDRHLNSIGLKKKLQMTD